MIILNNELKNNDCSYAMYNKLTLDDAHQVYKVNTTLCKNMIHREIEVIHKLAYEKLKK